MDDLLRRVRRLKSHVQLLDGCDDFVNSTCKCLIDNECMEIKSLLASRKKEAQKRKEIILEQKDVIEKLQMTSARLEYMRTNLPIECLENINQVNDCESPCGVEQTIYQGPSGNHEYPQPSIVVTPVPKTPAPITDYERTVSAVQTPKPRKDMEVSISYVTNKEFSEIPDYMRGRLKVNDVNSFIDVFNKTLSKKYALLQRTKNSIKLKNELEKYVNWKGQINSDTKGLYFCTAEDVASEGECKFGKKEFSLITILRHLKRIREIRNKKLVFYVACF